VKQDALLGHIIRRK